MVLAWNWMVGKKEGWSQVRWCRHSVLALRRQEFKASWYYRVRPRQERTEREGGKNRVVGVRVMELGGGDWG